MKPFKFALLFATVCLFVIVLSGVVSWSVLAQDTPPVLDGVVASAVVRVSPRSPWDAAPNADGTTLFYTATSDDGCGGVFSVNTQGSDITPLATCQPLVMPLGIAVSSDDQHLYVTDPWTAGAFGNAILMLSTTGSGQVPTVISGTSGTMPQGVEVLAENGVEYLYFSGIDPFDSQPAVLKIPASGADSPTILYKGSPLVAPSGIAVSSGAVYVLDRLASGNGLGSVFRIQNGTIEEIAADVRTGGQLAGLTLTLDGSLLLVSSLDAMTGTAQVLVINTATLEPAIVNQAIGENTSAGGLHRAQNANILAWVDNQKKGGGNNQGQVYQIVLN